MAGRFCCGKSSQHPEGGNPRFASIVACTRLFTNGDKTSTHNLTLPGYSCYFEADIVFERKGRLAGLGALKTITNI